MLYDITWYNTYSPFSNIKIVFSENLTLVVDKIIGLSLSKPIWAAQIIIVFKFLYQGASLNFNSIFSWIDSPTLNFVNDKMFFNDA